MASIGDLRQRPRRMGIRPPAAGGRRARSPSPSSPWRSPVGSAGSPPRVVIPGGPRVAVLAVSARRGCRSPGTSRRRSSIRTTLVEAEAGRRPRSTSTDPPAPRPGRRPTSIVASTHRRPVARPRRPPARDRWRRGTFHGHRRLPLRSRHGDDDRDRARPAAPAARRLLASATARTCTSTCRPDADGYTDDALELGKLKATDGAFGYDLPAESTRAASGARSSGASSSATCSRRRHSTSWRVVRKFRLYNRPRARIVAQANATETSVAREPVARRNSDSSHG